MISIKKIIPSLSAVHHEGGSEIQEICAGEQGLLTLNPNNRISDTNIHIGTWQVSESAITSEKRCSYILTGPYSDILWYKLVLLQYNKLYFTNNRYKILLELHDLRLNHVSENYTLNLVYEDV